MRSRLSFFVAVSSTLAVLGSPALAESASQTHDGFLLRLNLGFGYESLSISNSDSDLSIGGFGAGANVALGGLVAADLAIQAELFGSAVVSPNVSQDGVDLGEANDVTLNLSGLGVGITYWIMPTNLYLVGMVGLSKATIEVEGSTFESDWGLALQAIVGKEFWVGDEWGVGFAGQLLWANVPTDTDSSSASYFAFNVLFSATYN